MVNVEAQPLSLSTIEPVAVGRVMVTPLDAPESPTVMDSVGSVAISSIVVTVIFLDVSPDAKLNVPVTAEKSLPDVAVPLADAKFTLAEIDVLPDRVTVKFKVPPSVTEASAIEILAGPEFGSDDV